MNFTDNLFPATWMIVAYGLLLPVWGWSLRTAPWRRLADSRQLHLWFATVLALTLTWSLNAGVRPGLNMHLLGATLFTLMFGRQLAIIGLTLVLALVTYFGAQSGAIGWGAYALNALIMMALPVFCAWAMLRAVERWLPPHLFIYVLVVTFLGAALNTLIVGAAATLLLGIAGSYPLQKLLEEFFLSYLLLAFAEAWLTGAIATLMIVFCPGCIGTFDDRRYLTRR
jgi:uncharacterized membrane protein